MAPYNIHDILSNRDDSSCQHAQDEQSNEIGMKYLLMESKIRVPAPKPIVQILPIPFTSKHYMLPAWIILLCNNCIIMEKEIG